MKSVHLSAAGERAQAACAEPAFQSWESPDGTPWAFFHRQPSGYLVRFPGIVDFEISADGQSVALWRAPGVPESTAQNLYLNQAVPLALSRQGQLVLHASAVEIDGHCLAFAGRSGRGKSTLAASFATSGHRFLTDDGLLLDLAGDRLVVQPSHPSIRLWADSQKAILPQGGPTGEAVDYTSKVRYLADKSLEFCDHPLPLHSMFFLQPGETTRVRIERLRPQAALVELVRHSFLLDISASDMLSGHFDEVSRIANLPIHYHLDYPRRFEELPALREALRRHAAQAPD